jgi:hypothetical protein
VSLSFFAFCFHFDFHKTWPYQPVPYWTSAEVCWNICPKLSFVVTKIGSNYLVKMFDLKMWPGCWSSGKVCVHENMFGDSHTFPCNMIIEVPRAL